jgi:metallophosphoesterase (TIGR00282 family)
LNVLAIGDVIGKPGRRALAVRLPQLKKEYAVDFTIANAENSAGGIGVTPETADEMIGAGVDVLTSGNHVWAHKDIYPVLDSEMPLLRPMNYPPGVPGKGHIAVKGVLVVNLIGRTFMANYDDPFRTMDVFLAGLKSFPRVIFVDFHAEATSEKVALGRYLDGRVTAVLGTHTHVGTIDASILPKGTAYVTDIGMTGPIDSVIGDETQKVLERFLTQLPNRLSAATGKCVINAVLVKVDEATGRAVGIERIQRETD